MNLLVNKKCGNLLIFCLLKLNLVVNFHCHYFSFSLYFPVITSILSVNKTSYWSWCFSALSREGRKAEAVKYLRLVVAYDPSRKDFLEECENDEDSFVGDLVSSRRGDYWPNAIIHDNQTIYIYIYSEKQQSEVYCKILYIFFLLLGSAWFSHV